VTDLPHDPEKEDDFRAAEYALGLSEGEDLAVARSRIRSDAGFAATVAAWQERLVALTDDIAPVAPPARLRKALMLRLFPRQRVPLLERLWVWRGLTLASLVALAVVTLPMLRPASGPDLFATQMRGDTGDLEVLAVVDTLRGGVALRRVAGTVPEGRVHELWAILPDQAPLSLGVLPADGNTHLPLPPQIAALAAQLTLAISDEPPGGAPEGTPTGEIRAVGTVDEI
jgi:anti-sigma-K factor RskA